MSDAPTISVLVVCHDSAGCILDALAALGDQLSDGDEVLVLDNASRDQTAALVAERAPWVALQRSAQNLGFAAGVNRLAARAGGDRLLLLNPDVVARPGALAALRAAAARWELCQGLVLQAGGEAINVAGGELHYLGLAWAGRIDRPAVEAGPERAVAFASGACCLVDRALFQRLGGLCEPFFMYVEDVDLSLRARLAGARVGLVPDAIFAHDYGFDKGARKWRALERNRWLCLLRCWPARLLWPLLPALLALEPLLLIVALRGGWGRAKLGAQGDVLRALPRVLGERRAIQTGVTIDAASFAAPLAAQLDSPYFGAVGSSAPIAAALRGFWALVRPRR